MRNTIQTIQVADIREKQTVQNEYKASDIYLMREPCERAVDAKVFRLATFKDGEFYFFGSKKTYPKAQVLPLISEKERFCCMYLHSCPTVEDCMLSSEVLENENDNSIRAVMSQNLVHFCSSTILGFGEKFFREYPAGRECKSVSENVVRELKEAMWRLNGKKVLSLDELNFHNKAMVAFQKDRVKKENYQEELSL